jgi:hypothetical protein
LASRRWSVRKRTRRPGSPPDRDGGHLVRHLQDDDLAGLEIVVAEDVPDPATFLRRRLPRRRPEPNEPGTGGVDQTDDAGDDEQEHGRRTGRKSGRGEDEHRPEADDPAHPPEVQQEGAARGDVQVTHCRAAGSAPA